MSNPFEHLLGLARAGATVLQIASYEWERVRGLLIGLARELQLPLRVWSSSTGLLSCDERGALTPEDDTLTCPVRALQQFQQQPAGGVLLLEDIHPFLEPQHHEVTRWVRELCRLRAPPRKLVVLATPLPGLPVELRKEVPSLDLPLPGAEDLRVICKDASAELGVPRDADDHALIEAARGLTVMEARLAFGQAGVALGRLGPGAVPFVIREKERAIKQSEVLEFYEPDARMSDVGGLDQLKAWLDRRGRAFGAGARDYGLDAPKGALLLGVQGCGKSLVAKAVAAAWQFPLLRFDMGRVFGGLVGQSEGNVRAALQVAQALSPCVLWIDEIEKGMSGQDDSTGINRRLIGQFLFWLQESRHRVFVVATANDVRALPPELLRKGRFDELFFVDLPDAGDRHEIIDMYYRRYVGEPPAPELLDKLVGLSDGFAGSDVESVLHEIGEAVHINGLASLRPEFVIDTFTNTVPLSRTNPEQIEEIRGWGRDRAVPAGRPAPVSTGAGPSHGRRVVVLGD